MKILDKFLVINIDDFKKNYSNYDFIGIRVGDYTFKILAYSESQEDNEKLHKLYLSGKYNEYLYFTSTMALHPKSLENSRVGIRTRKEDFEKP